MPHIDTQDEVRSLLKKHNLLCFLCQKTVKTGDDLSEIDCENILFMPANSSSLERFSVACCVEICLGCRFPHTSFQFVFLTQLGNETIGTFFFMRQ